MKNVRRTVVSMIELQNLEKGVTVLYIVVIYFLSFFRVYAWNVFVSGIDSTSRFHKLAFFLWCCCYCRCQCRSNKKGSQYGRDGDFR